jgi:hypothetical protein
MDDATLKTAPRGLSGRSLGNKHHDWENARKENEDDKV